MSDYADSTCFAIQTARQNILEIVDSVAVNFGGGDDLRKEAENVLAMMISACVLADGNFGANEEKLISFAVPCLEGELDREKQLFNLAAGWEDASKKLPHFFVAAAEYNRADARAILRELQLLGNNIAACDLRFTHHEQKFIQGYIAFLEHYLDTR